MDTKFELELNSIQYSNSRFVDEVANLKTRDNILSLDDDEMVTK